ncbi:hypothetical protein EYR40_003066 [Pleurotus pulmonarius]|nr:hypothetical protein EYR36_005517 [Pleurotus pulmonarius]KAF4580667.1 hypothetical protein EYR40_003066 [Pleurotus pulmonarius]
MPALPSETVQEILGYVDDTPTLLNCLLASRGFKYPATRALYRSVTLHGKQLEAFRRAIDANPQYAEYTISFQIYGARSQPPNPFRNLNYILSKLSNLRTLNMRAMNWRWEDYQASLGPSSPPTLTKLTTLIWRDDSSPLTLIQAFQNTLEHMEIVYRACSRMTEQDAPLKGMAFPRLRSITLPHGGTIKPALLGLQADQWKAAYSTVSRTVDGYTVMWNRRW